MNCPPTNDRNATSARRWPLRDLASMWMRVSLAPRRWHRRLRHVSVPALLGEIEAEFQGAPPLELPLGWIAYCVRRRAVLSIRWRRRRCLLSGLLFADLLPRAGYSVTVHLGCLVGQADHLTAHCWISSPDTEAINRFMSPGGMTEMYRRTLLRRAGMDYARRREAAWP